MEANLGSESVKCIPQHRHFQNGNSGDNPAILTDRGVGHIARLQRRILPHPNCPKVKEVSQVLPVQTNLPVHISPLWSGHSSAGVHQGGQGGETYGPRVRIHQYLDDWLLRPPSPEICLHHTQTLLALCQRLGWVVSMTKSELVPKQVFNFVPVRPGDRSRATHTGPVGSSPGKVEIYQRPKQLYGQTIHVSNRPSHSNRKTSVFRPSSHETHSVAPEEALARPRSFRKGNSYSSIAPPAFRLVARRVQCAERSTITPASVRSSAVYRCLKRRLGCTLRGLHCKRRLVIH